MGNRFTLNGSEAYTTGGGVDEDVVAGLDAGAGDEGAVARGRGDEQAGRVLERPALGHGEEGDLLGDALGGEGALVGAEDSRADGELWLCRVGGSFQHDAGELGAGSPGKGCREASAEKLFLKIHT